MTIIITNLFYLSSWEIFLVQNSLKLKFWPFFTLFYPKPHNVAGRNDITLRDGKTHPYLNIALNALVIAILTK